MSFEGNYRRKKQINLGNHVRETKSTLLRKAQQERKSRERDRQIEQAAVDIQSFYRGRKAAAAVRAQRRELWDEIVSNTSVWDADTVINLVEKLRLFFRSYLDHSRAYTLVQAISQCDDTTDIISILFSKKNSFLSKLADTLLQSLYFDPSEDLGFIQFFFSNETLVRSLISHKLFAKLAHVPFDHSRLDDFSLLLVQGVVNALRNQKETTYFAFITEYLSVPNVLYQLPSASKQFLFINLSRSEIGKFIRPVDNEALSPESWSWVLAHFLQFPMSPPHSRSYFGSLLRMLRITSSLSESVRPMAVVDTEIEMIAPRGKLINSLPALSADDVDSLYSSEMIDQLIYYQSQPQFEEAAAILMHLIRLSPERKPQILMRLVLQSTSGKLNAQSPLSRLWDLIEHSEIYSLGIRNEKVEPGVLFNRDLEHEWTTFVLYLELLSRMLLTLVDDEFFNEENSVIHLESISRLIILLKCVAYSLYWPVTPISDSTTLETTGYLVPKLSALVTNLLQTLQQRNARRSFVNDDLFLIDDFKDEKGFIAALTTELDTTPKSALPFGAGGHSNEKLRNTYALPRLNILRKCPFFVPFETRVKIFRALIHLDKERINVSYRSRQRVIVHRDRIFEDAFDHVYPLLGDDIKVALAIEMVDQFGYPEAGIDGGGLTKEFLTSITADSFNPEYGLFKETPDHLYYPNPSSHIYNNSHLAYIEFLGKIVGKCLYEGILIDVGFAPFFLMKWHNQRSYLDDLQSLDPELYRGLMILKHYDGDVEADFALNYTLNDSEVPDKIIRLLPGGDNIPVTSQNRLQYIHLVSNYRLNTQIARQSEAFVSGLSALIDPTWIGMFNARELQALVGGTSTPIDLEDLRDYTVFCYSFSLSLSNTSI